MDSHDKGRNSRKGQGCGGGSQLLWGTEGCHQELLRRGGTAGEKAAAEKLIAALEECVEPIDATIEFLKSEKGKEILGADTAAAVLKTAEDAKAKGEKICPCPACQNGKAVLENKAVLMA